MVQQPTNTKHTCLMLITIIHLLYLLGHTNINFAFSVYPISPMNMAGKLFLI